MPDITEIKTYLSGHGIEVWEYQQPTPTCPTAAAAVGCSVAEIAKTLLFLVGGDPVAVVTCGDMKVNSSRLKKSSGLSGKVRLPQPEDVQLHTGYLPGGVCPFLLPAELPVLLDRSLQRFPRVYAAAGNGYSAVPVRWHELLELTGGAPAELCDPLAQE